MAWKPYFSLPIYTAPDFTKRTKKMLLISNNDLKISLFNRNYDNLTGIFSSVMQPNKRTACLVAIQMTIQVFFQETLQLYNNSTWISTIMQPANQCVELILYISEVDSMSSAASHDLMWLPMSCIKNCTYRCSVQLTKQKGWCIVNVMPAVFWQKAQPLLL